MDNFTTCSLHKTFFAFVKAFTHFTHFMLFPSWWAMLKEVDDTYSNGKVVIFQQTLMNLKHFPKKKKNHKHFPSLDSQSSQVGTSTPDPVENKIILPANLLVYRKLFIHCLLLFTIIQ